MSTETVETTTEIPAVKPSRAPRKKRAKRAIPRRAKDEAQPPTPVKGGKWAGVSATACCAGCTPEHCLISTVDVCKHPNKTGDGGCGPITMANRAEVRKLIKHQMIDLKG